MLKRLFDALFRSEPFQGARPDGAGGLQESDVDTLVRLVHKYVWPPLDVRKRLEQGGAIISRNDFYSEAPTLSDFDASFEYDAGRQKPAFHNPDIFSLKAMEAEVLTLAEHSASFSPPTQERPDGFYWGNPQFSGSDAAFLYAMIKRYRPSTVVEIGCGFSSYVARLALDELSPRGRLLCIDPEPRSDVSKVAGIEFRRSRIQDVPLEDILTAIKPGDFVFYDGSHTIKTGSDAVYFYFKILPYLPVGTYVHAHDVCLPYALPSDYLIQHKLSWTEPYVLLAHLHNTSRYKVLSSTAMLQLEAPERLALLTHGRYESGGSSLWYEVVG